MNKTLKIGFWIVLILIAIAAVFFITPKNAWEQYKERHPSLFEVEDEATPTYWNFCISFWKTFFKTKEDNEDEFTYDGGELPEIVITPSKS